MSCESVTPPLALFESSSATTTVSRVDDSEAAIVFEGDDAMKLGDLPEGVQWIQWEVKDLAGAIALGIGNGAVFGPDVLNFMYVSDGRIVKDGAVLASAPAFGSGDIVGMLVDTAAQTAAFWLNGEQVI